MTKKLQKQVSRGYNLISKTVEHLTPQPLFDRLDAKYHFTLDPCATAENAKCKRYFTMADDGLKQSWANERVFMNPPYGRGIKAWIAKAYESSVHGATVVCLLPARTDTVWFHEYCLNHGEVEFIPRRLKFAGHKHNAPLPSMIVVFKNVWEDKAK